jgi:hypothetical protein
MTEHFTLVTGTRRSVAHMTPLKGPQKLAEAYRDKVILEEGIDLVYIHLLKHTPDGFVEIE